MWYHSFYSSPSLGYGGIRGEKGHFYWVGQNVCLVFSIKQKTHFSFSPITTDLDSFSMSAISHYLLLVGVEAPGAATHLPMHKTAPQQRIIWPKSQQFQETSQTTFDMLDQSQHLHTLQKSFLHFSSIFTFLEIIKHNMPKMLCIFFHLQY